jgi:hypothetical protein
MYTPPKSKRGEATNSRVCGKDNGRGVCTSIRENTHTHTQYLVQVVVFVSHCFHGPLHPGCVPPYHEECGASVAAARGMELNLIKINCVGKENEKASITGEVKHKED